MKMPLIHPGYIILVSGGVLGALTSIYSSAAGIAIISGTVLVAIILFLLDPISEAFKRASDIEIGPKGISMSGIHPRSQDEQRRSLAEEGQDSISLTPQSRIPSEVVLAEDLALREIADEYGAPVTRQVTLSGDIEVGFDGVLWPGGQLIAAEVKLLKTRISADLVHGAAENAVRLAGSKATNIHKILLVIVSKGIMLSEQLHAVEAMKQVASNAAVPIEFRLFDFDELKEKYGIDNN